MNGDQLYGGSIVLVREIYTDVHEQPLPGALLVHGQHAFPGASPHPTLPPPAPPPLPPQLPPLLQFDWIGLPDTSHTSPSGGNATHAKQVSSQASPQLPPQTPYPMSHSASVNLHRRSTLSGHTDGAGEADRELGAGRGAKGFKQKFCVTVPLPSKETQQGLVEGQHSPPQHRPSDPSSS